MISDLSVEVHRRGDLYEAAVGWRFDSLSKDGKDHVYGNWWGKEWMIIRDKKRKRDTERLTEESEHTQAILRLLHCVSSQCLLFICPPLYLLLSLSHSISRDDASSVYFSRCFCFHPSTCPSPLFFG
ncbi:hypothetical protein QQP08_027319 [Theobroma cacao]|nr:hypothetical protein QQP08_027319 [Theobroma cacao]